MKWKHSTLIILLMIISSLGCKDNIVILPTSPSYSYLATDSSGIPLVQGLLTLSWKDSTITGTWKLSKIGNAQNTGPQIGNGTLRGTIHNGIYYIDMNPGWADNNVFLIGRIEDEIFLRGSWTWSTIVGPTNGGTFEAKENRPEPD